MKDGMLSDGDDVEDEDEDDDEDDEEDDEDDEGNSDDDEDEEDENELKIDPVKKANDTKLDLDTIKNIFDYIDITTRRIADNFNIGNVLERQKNQINDLLEKNSSLERQVEELRKELDNRISSSTKRSPALYQDDVDDNESLSFSQYENMNEAERASLLAKAISTLQRK